MRASRIQTLTRGRADLQWAAQLARMCQVALIGYVVGGAFLGLAYFDLPYVIMALIVVTGAYVERTLQAERTAAASPAGRRSAGTHGGVRCVERIGAVTSGARQGAVGAAAASMLVRAAEPAAQRLLVLIYHRVLETPDPLRAARDDGGDLPLADAARCSATPTCCRCTRRCGGLRTVRCRVAPSA